MNCVMNSPEHLQTNLFENEEIVTWSDIHFGKSNNSILHNERCLSFIKWMISEAKARGITKSVFMGDYFHNRASLNVQTLDYGLEGMSLINDNFEDTYWIVGNHDLYFRDNRNVASTSIAHRFPNVHFINEPMHIGNCSFWPWLVGDDWKKVNADKSKYAFGHFEVPNFYLNSMVKMPDHGDVKITSFKNQDLVFSGHFHCRQQQKNVVYTGNCFPHNYSDAWDDKRGVMFLEWNKKPEYKTWPDQPVYRTLMLSQVLLNPPKYLTKNTYAKITIDVNLDFEELHFIKEKFVDVIGVCELTFVQMKADISGDDSTQLDSDLRSIDEIFIDNLDTIDSKTLDRELLKAIYLGL